MNEPAPIAFPHDDAALAAQRPAPVFQRCWLLAGELREWPGPVHEVLSPICLRLPDGSLQQAAIGHYPRLGEVEALAAVAAAAAAYDQGRGVWPTMPVAARIRAVEDFALRMRAQREEMVRLLMWEIGKTRGDSEKEFDRTLQYIRDTIDALKDLDRVSSRFTIAEGILAQIRRAPLGVTLCMGPYNYPLNETFTTLIPALLMGNTIVFKPAKFGVLLLRPLLEAFRDAFPAGVVNTVYGEGRTIIGPMLASGKVDCLAFIGTARVADTLKKQHPEPHRLRCVLGLDAKNPAIVLPDADLAAALDECVLGALSFNGQRCTALKILFVHEAVYAPFLAGLAERVDRLACGLPWEPDARITPLPEAGKTAYLAGLVADAVALGARVVNPGGARVEGTFFAPAVVAPVDARMRLWREEQFGPVVPVVPFRSVDEPLRYIVESNFGQQVSVFGRDPAALGALIDPLVNQVSRVNLNSQCQRGPDVFPFTGRKDSAEGTLSVSDALRVFSIRALVAAKGTDENKALVTEILRERRSNWLSTDFLF
ncbi:MAG: NADP-dependent glyceraldehyde-3-phosphate dehydrogenase [Candidatus Krumholzibacteriia bacterium]